MFGFLIGAACLGGLAAVLFRRPHFHGHHAGGCHSRGYGFRRGRYALNMAFERLDTTPGQEKAILSAIDELRDAARDMRSKVSASRVEVGAALRAERFESERVDAAVAKHAEDFAALGSSLTRTLAKIHDALDPEQRKRVARWLESGPGFLHFA